jgi:hypothetical protein
LRELTRRGTEDTSTAAPITVITTVISAEPEEIEAYSSLAEADNRTDDVDKQEFLSPVAEEQPLAVTPSAGEGSATQLAAMPIAALETQETHIFEAEDDNSPAGVLLAEVTPDAAKLAIPSLDNVTDLLHGISEPTMAKLPLPLDLAYNPTISSHPIDYFTSHKTPSGHGFIASGSSESSIVNKSPLKEFIPVDEPSPVSQIEASIDSEEHAQEPTEAQLACEAPRKAPAVEPTSEFAHAIEAPVEKQTPEPIPEPAADKPLSVHTIEQQIQDAIDSAKTPVATVGTQTASEEPAASEPVVQPAPMPAVDEVQLAKEREEKEAAEKEAAEAKAREDAVWADFDREAKAREETLARGTHLRLLLRLVHMTDKRICNRSRGARKGCSTSLSRCPSTQLELLPLALDVCRIDPDHSDRFGPNQADPSTPCFRELRSKWLTTAGCQFLEQARRPLAARVALKFARPHAHAVGREPPGLVILRIAGRAARNTRNRWEGERPDCDDCDRNGQRRRSPSCDR